MIIIIDKSLQKTINSTFAKVNPGFEGNECYLKIPEQVPVWNGNNNMTYYYELGIHVICIHSSFGIITKAISSIPKRPSLRPQHPSKGFPWLRERRTFENSVPWNNLRTPYPNLTLILYTSLTVFILNGRLILMPGHLFF